MFRLWADVYCLQIAYFSDYEDVAIVVQNILSFHGKVDLFIYSILRKQIILNCSVQILLRV